MSGHGVCGGDVASGLEGERDGLHAERNRLVGEQARLEAQVRELQVPAAASACHHRLGTARDA